MKQWFISDTHFSHANIIRLCGRPFKDVEEMNRELILRWNECIGVVDLVFFLGDFGLGSVDHLKNILSKLNGYVICIRGNHDGNHARLHNIGFDVILESAFISLGGHRVELIHIPSEAKPPHFQLHGHVHEKKPNEVIDNKLNLSVEAWGYRPVYEKKIIGLLDAASKKK